MSKEDKIGIGIIAFLLCFISLLVGYGVSQYDQTKYRVNYKFQDSVSATISCSKGPQELWSKRVDNLTSMWYTASEDSVTGSYRTVSSL